MIKNNQSGQILVIVFVALGVVLFTVLSLVAGAQIYFQNASYSINAEKATALAEAGIDKAITSFNELGGSYTGENETSLDEGSFSVVITTKDSATKIIESTGYLPNKTNPKVKRTVRIEASQGVGISFVYGVQVGDGGMELGNSNSIIGSVYSNGSITGNNSNRITGDVWVAGGQQANADQQADCQGNNCTDFLFGKNISGQNRLDIAQSFKPSISAVLNKISIKLKKVGNPPDLTARILADNNGSPNKNNVLASGTLYSSLVTSEYGWIDVTFNSSPNLSSNNTYWFMLDTASNSTNYWSWQNDIAQSYTGGLPKWSANWSASSPVWSGFTGGGDLSFKTFMGGTITFIRGGNSDEVLGNVHANTIDNLDIEGDAYYQTIINSDVDGELHSGSEDPAPKVFPISESNITEWKNQAQQAGALTNPDCNQATPWGPGKYTGNLTINNSCKETVKAPIWVTGNFTMNNSNEFKLASEYGTASGVIIVDGVTNLGNSNKLSGTGQGSSFMLLISTYDSRTSGIAAIDANNSGNSGALYADKGIIEPGNSNNFKELTAWKIRLLNSTTITYETGLSSALFSSGPSGSYTLVKGTYQVK